MGLKPDGRALRSSRSALVPLRSMNHQIAPNTREQWSHVDA